MTRSRLRPVAITVAAVLALLLVIIALFPWGALRGIVQDRLTDRFGRPVTIASVRRVDTIGFTPTIAITGVRVAQADWAGTGDFARIGRVEVTFPVWPLLRGVFQPRDVRVDGLRLALVRDKDGRTNWERPGKPARGGGSTDLKGLAIRDAIVSYRDARQDRQIVARVTSDAKRIAATGTGTVRGAAVTLSFEGSAVDQPVPGPWPFTAALEGRDLAIRATGTMDRPLDTDHMAMEVDARAADLKLIDAVIEAGLFRTRPVAFQARVRHDMPRWTIPRITGTIGRSDLAGDLIVDKIDGRNRIDGNLRFGRLDFGDLSSAEGRARAAALERAIGPRIVPDTRIDIGKIRNTDGRLAFAIGRIVDASPARSAKGVLTMDRQLLTLSPFAMRLADGRVTGRATVDQRGGKAMPVVTMDLTLRDASVLRLAAGSDVTGRIAGRARLTGRGETIRAVVARSSGSIGLVARDGRLPERYAAALGFDAGRALLAGSEARAGLRCMILRLRMRGGEGTVAPFVVDTTESQLRGTGAVRFPAETIAMRLTGAPKRGSILRLPGAATVSGTLSDPVLTIPPEVRSVGNILKAIGRKIRGDEGPRAVDADCAALSAQALR